MIEKMAHEEKWRRELQAWEDKIEEVKSAAEQVGNPADAEAYRRELEHYLQKRDEVQAKLGRIAESSKDAWVELKGEVEQSLEELKAQGEKVVARLG